MPRLKPKLDQELIEKINEICETRDTSLDPVMRAYVIEQLKKTEWDK